MSEATDALTFIVRVDVAKPSEGGVTEIGSKEAVAPFGRPEMERLTTELKPFRDVMFIVELPESPWMIVNEDGDAEIEKSGTARAASS